MGKKGLYKQTKGSIGQKKPEQKQTVFQNVAPAGRESIDPTGDIAAGIFLESVGGICHLWSKTQFTLVLWILMCIVAVYLIGRGIKALIKQNKQNKK